MSEQLKQLPETFATKYAQAIEPCIPADIMERARAIVASHRAEGVPGAEVFNHYTMKRFNMSYTGLHETQEEAEAGKAAYVQEKREHAWTPNEEQKIRGLKGRSQSEVDADAEEWEREGKIVELQEGDVYRQWGDHVSTRIHGKDDGTHGSTRRRNTRQQVTEPIEPITTVYRPLK